MLHRLASVLLVSVLWLATPPPTRAEPAEAVTMVVHFRTIPAVVNVSSSLGNSFQNNATLLFAPPGYAASVTLSRTGYHQLTNLVILSDQLREERCWPAKDSPPLELTPLHFWVPYEQWASEHKVAAIAVLLLAGGTGLGGFVYGRVALVRRGRQRELERTVDRADSLALQTVGGYVLAQPLGSGGMATVYRGLPVGNLDSRQAVAVKVLSREALHDAEFRERFRREVNAYRKLEHPNIVRLLDWGEQDEGLIFIVLELVDGHTIREEMRQPIPPARLSDLLSQLFGAVHYAHQRGIIHRDLKPENLMLTRAGVLKVMDFGLARHQDVERLTRTDTLIGTPAYMAPEQLLGLPSVDGRLDQYALGVICYELLCGHIPYEEKDLMSLLAQIMNVPPVPLRTRAPQYSAELEAVLTRMLEKKPDKRFADVAEAWATLAKVLPG